MKIIKLENILTKLIQKSVYSWPVTVLGGHYLLGRCQNEKVRPKTDRAAQQKSESIFEAWSGVKGRN